MAERFPAEFFTDLERLTFELRRLAAVQGEGRAAIAGAEAQREFTGHTPYVQGADPRHIDWNAYGRLGKLFLKQFAAERESVLTLVPDLSRSMDSGEPTRLDVALRMVAVFAALALRGGADVALVLGQRVQRFSGAQKFSQVIDALRNAKAEGDTFFSKLGQAVTSAPLRNVIVISDLMEPPEHGRALQALGHNLTLIGLLSPDELSPSMDGALTFIDVEDSARVSLELGESERAMYREELDAHLRGWQEFCARQRWTFGLCSSVTPLSELFISKLAPLGVVRWGS
ncbi:MAG: DUF58 domain-containing protein [Planctomycetes bacterium]|nr:DUF58 domain-containing protein [Planctomycetota bacterium]NUQ35086.1 DUF58 domain-containing protein [Planctomycetaceae bacterium]